jgi:hypothetical protein
MKDGIQAAHHITTKAAAITGGRTKATLMATETMTGMKATNTTRGTTGGMKATLMDTRSATGPMTLAIKATLAVMTMAMTSKAMVMVMAAMTLASKGMIAGAKAMDGGTVGAITGLIMSVPTGGNNATACNLVKIGTAASSRLRLTTSWHYAALRTAKTDVLSVF